MRARLEVLLVAGVALLTNLGYYLCSNGDFFFPDSATYLIPAQHLWKGLGFTTKVGVAETIRTPGYPLFLLPFVAAARGGAAIVLGQHLLNVAIAIAIVLFTRRRLGERASLVAALLFAIDPPSIHIANKVLSEGLFTAMLFALFVLAMRIAQPAVGNGRLVRSTRTPEESAPWAVWLIAGLLAGALVMVRPVAVLYFIVLAAFFLLERQQLRRIVAFVAIAAVIPIGWALRNRIEGGAFTVSSVAGINMLQYRAAGAIAILDGGDWKPDLTDRQEELIGDADDEIQRTLRIDDAQELPIAVRAGWYGRIGRRRALEHPIGLALLTFRGVLVNLFESDWEAVMVVSDIDASIVQILVDGWTSLIIFLATIGIAFLWRRDRTLALLIALTVGYFLLISAGGEAEYRFRVPVVPMIAIAAAYGFEGIARGVRTE